MAAQAGGGEHGSHSPKIDSGGPVPAREYVTAIGEYPHTAGLLDGSISPEGCHLTFVSEKPAYKMFAPMVRDLAYDVSELALVTFLQAREAGKPISLLPVVLAGGSLHRTLTRLSSSPAIAPEDLVGKRVGVRAYSQTTGAWVRGALKEEFGIDAGDLTWVTTEGPHVSEYVEPDNVERTDRSLVDLLRDGDVAAAVTRPGPLPDGLEIVPVLPDWQQAEQRWAQRHGSVPINHVLTIRTDVLESDARAATSIYDAFARNMLAAGVEGVSTTSAIGAGVNDSLVSALDTAVEYARDQRLISRGVSAEELLRDYERYVAMA